MEIYRDVQNIAKKTHEHLGAFINSESTEQPIAKKACELLSDFGETLLLTPTETN